MALEIKNQSNQKERTFFFPIKIYIIVGPKSLLLPSWHEN
jgi:hypothetical protein